MNTQPTQRIDVLVIGGSQAGLAMGYHLARQGRRFLILDAGERVGDAWRQRYDSLVLFTPSQCNGLPGLPFPLPDDVYPTRDQVADYLDLYARTFQLPVRTGSRVSAVEPDVDGYRVRTQTTTYRAAQVVVASGGFQAPYVPAFASDLSPELLQLHSSQYRNPTQLRPGSILVVGGGNSGAQIAAELARERQVYLSLGKRLASLPQRFLGRDIQWWLRRVGLMDVTADSRLGRRLRERDSLIGTDLKKLVRENGLGTVDRVVQAQADRIITADGETLAVQNVIWATGYRPDYSWIHVPVFDQQGAPVHTRGVTPAPGLYFLGLYWQHTRGSALLGGVGADAEYLATRMAEHATHAACDHGLPRPLVPPARLLPHLP